MAWAVLDSSVYLGHWERGDFAEELELVEQTFIVRHSSVVLSELRRGARTRLAQRRIDELYRLARAQWDPTAQDWWEAGKLIRVIGDAQGWDTRKRLAFQNDALIALTARRYGAIIVTANQADFALFGRAVGVLVLSV